MPRLWVYPDDLKDYSIEDDASEAAQAASFILWALSGRKFGLATAIETYECSCRPGVRPAGPIAWPWLDGSGAISNVAARCPCDGSSRRHKGLRLRGTPIVSVESVTAADGELLDPSEYSVTQGDRSRLVVPD